MHQQFTDRARTTMQIANAEAIRLEQDQIGTAAILLGLTAAGESVAMHVVTNGCGLDRERLRDEVLTRLRTGTRYESSDKLRQSSSAKKVIQHAMEEARGLAHDHVGTEHFLLGLLREQDGRGGRVLRDAGLTVEQVRRVLKTLGEKELSSLEAKRPATNAWRQALVAILVLGFAAVVAIYALTTASNWLISR